MTHHPSGPALPEAGIELVARFRLESQHLLDPGPPHSIESLVSETGWLHSTSAKTPYLALFPRCGGICRSELDSALFESHALLELPGSRACTFVVPAAEGHLCLLGYSRDVETRISRLRKAENLAEAEVDRMETAVRGALAHGPLPVEELRAKIPREENRDLGSAGQNAGYRNILAVALARLQARGLVIKMAADGRLDSGRNTFALSKKVVPDVRLRPVGPAETARKLALLYFAAAGPATLEDFAWWADIPPEEARTAVDALGGELSPVRIAGERAPSFVPTASLERLLSPGPAVEVTTLLLPHRDNLFGMRRGASCAVRPEHVKYPILDWRGGTTPAGVAGAAHHAPVVLSGFVMGAWAFDPKKGAIQWETFEPLDAGPAASLDQQAAGLARFIREDLGGTASAPGDDTMSGVGRVQEMARLWRSLRRPPAKRRPAS
jgi:hypothetical protein